MESLSKALGKSSGNRYSDVLSDTAWPRTRNACHSSESTTQLLLVSMARTFTFKQWEDRKEEILRLYIVEGLALKPVMRAMRAPDFDPS